jgi:hypothetical protein
MRHHIGTLWTRIFPTRQTSKCHPKLGGCQLCNALKDRYPETRDFPTPQEVNKKLGIVKITHVKNGMSKLHGRFDNKGRFYA